MKGTRCQEGWEEKSQSPQFSTFKVKGAPHKDK